MRIWHGPKGLLRRPLLALTVLAAAGALAAGCGNSSGSGGGGTYVGGPVSTSSGQSGVATITAASSKLVVNRPGFTGGLVP